MKRPRQFGPEPEGIGSLPLFLSLFLLLLAFFLFLNSISSLEAGRSDEVLRSVRASFPSLFKGGEGAGALQADGQAFDPAVRDRVAAVLADARPLLVEAPYVDGNPIHADLDVGTLFHPGSFEPQAAIRTLFGQLAPIVASPGDGRRIDLSLMLGYQPEGDDPVSIRRLDRLRIARLGETMRDAGIPGDRVAIGLEPGPRERLRLSLAMSPAGTRAIVGESGIVGRGGR